MSSKVICSIGIIAVATVYVGLWLTAKVIFVAVAAFILGLLAVSVIPESD